MAGDLLNARLSLLSPQLCILSWKELCSPHGFRQKHEAKWRLDVPILRFPSNLLPVIQYLQIFDLGNSILLFENISIFQLLMINWILNFDLGVNIAIFFIFVLTNLSPALIQSCIFTFTFRVAVYGNFHVLYQSKHIQLILLPYDHSSNRITIFS